jgi:serine/threonine protein kinase/nucleoside-diphosphate-sugar epimerase
MSGASPKRVLLCGHRAFAARGLRALLERRGHVVTEFSRGAVAQDGAVVTGPVAELHLNPHLAPAYDTIVNFIVLKHETIERNLAYLDSLLKTCRRCAVEHIVHISSMSLYRDETRCLTEDAPVKTDPAQSGAYASLKVAAELYLNGHTPARVKLSLLRPAYILGEGIPDPVGSVGQRLASGEILVLGRASRPRPVIARDKLHQAIARLVAHPPVEPREVLLLVDPRSPTCPEYLQACCDLLGAGTRALARPTPLWFPAFLQRELRSGWRAFSARRFLRSLAYRCRDQRYDPSRTEQRLGLSLTADWHRALAEPRFSDSQLLAVGGASHLERAFDRRLGRLVAVKVITPARIRHHAISLLAGYPCDERHVAEKIDFVTGGIRNEISILSSIAPNPHVVRLLDHVENRDGFVLVFEYAGGGTLSDPVNRRRARNLDQALAVVRGLLVALRAVHAAGFVHADIKPNQVLLRNGDPSGVLLPVLCDFGLARPLSRESAGAPSAPGSDFHAPEEFRSTARGDLYSLGCLLFYLVTGTEPHSHPPDLSRVGSGWTVAFLARLLQRSGADSFRSAEEALAALDGRRERLAPVAARLPRNEIHAPSLAECLYLMPSTACNLACKFCGYAKMVLPKQMMPDALFCEIIEKAVSYGFSRFGLTPMAGEALLDPHFLAKLEFLEQHPGVAGYSFCTNFLTADEELIGALVRLRKLTWFSITLYGHNPATFAAITGGRPGSFHRVLDNLERLAAVPELRFPLELRIRTVRSFQRSECPEPLAGLLARFAARNAVIRVPHDLYSNRGGLISDDDLQGVDIALKTEECERDAPCVFLFYKHTVLPDGRLNACYTGDVNATMIIGDLARQSFEEVYSLRNDAFLDLLHAQFDRRFDGVCRHCTDYRSITATHYSFRYHNKPFLSLAGFLDQLH